MTANPDITPAHEPATDAAHESATDAGSSDAVRCALSLGFEFACDVTPDMLTCKPEMRDLCLSGQCPNADTNWSCPPGAGTIDECTAELNRYAHGVLVQTFVDDIDTADAALVDPVRIRHTERMDALAAALREKYGDVLELTTGGCGICEKCTYPDKPCCKPTLRRASISAHGLDMVEVAGKAGMEYAFEAGRLRFIGMVMY